MREGLNVLMLIVGFMALIKGADIFVEGASSIAKKLGVPSVIVGLTIISIGTSAPELAVSTISAVNGSNGIAIGNILGSNIFNTLIVLGGTTLAMPIIIKKDLIKRDFLFNLCIIVLLYMLTYSNYVSFNDGILNRINGLILISLCFIYTITLIKSAMKTKIKEKNNVNIKIGINLFRIIMGILGIIIGGEFVVEGASEIALFLGMSENLVGLTVVAMGTSLPELVTSVVAALKGETEIAIGNVLGSNIFNILLILGVSSSINPIEVSGGLRFDMIFLFVSTLIIGVLFFMNNDKKIKKLSRGEGILLISFYIIYLTFIILRN
ncbi:MAG: calcium/sodium antiporter [Romboutsia sp.]|uniref:calcium/sodium antiporter n=1 Tax=Romboutsia sp. TaxID=1965302 RepID=UPI003F2D4BB0